MASGPDAVDRFEREGLFVVSPALTARRLRETAPDLWPASGKGGGKNSPQVSATHLTAFLLGQAAHLPSDAAAAVAALLPLRVTAEEVLVQPVPEKATPFLSAIWAFELMGQTLGGALQTHIAQASDPKIRAMMPGVLGANWALTLCIDPAFATVSYQTGKWIKTVVFGSRSHTGRARRLIELPYKVITICGELWEDSQRKSATPGRVALPQSPSAAHVRESVFSKRDLTACVRAKTTTPRGPDDRFSPPEPTASAAPS